MIYRILASTSIWSDELDGDEGPLRIVGTQLRGAYSAGVNEGFEEISTPRFKIPRARFYFTTRGWQRFGPQIVATAQRQGRTVRVLRLKNPRCSQIVYQDHYQVAILPRR